MPSSNGFLTIWQILMLLINFVINELKALTKILSNFRSSKKLKI